MKQKGMSVISAGFALRFAGIGPAVLIVCMMALTAQPTAAGERYEPVQADPVRETWRWRSFPELKGLGLQCMAEDRAGSLWFGLDSEVRRYDGVTWTRYPEKNGPLGQRTRTFCVTRDGSIYAGTYQGISRFRDGNWKPVFPTAGDLPWNITDLTEASDGSLWAATWWGLLKLGAGEPVLYTIADYQVQMRALAPDVRLVIIPDVAAPLRTQTQEGPGIGWVNIGEVSGRRMVTYLYPGGPAARAGLELGDVITAVNRDPDGLMEASAGASMRLTVARQGGSGAKDVTLTAEKVETKLRDFWIYDLHEDQEGKMWLGLHGSAAQPGSGEIVRFDVQKGIPKEARAWRLYTEADGLELGWRPRILQTRDGTIWTVSRHSFTGVNRFDGKTWTHFRLSDLGGMDSNPSILEISDGTLWIGGFGTGAIHAYRNGAWTVYKAPELLVPRNYMVGLLEASDGAIWMAGEGQEAARLDYAPKRWTTYEGLLFQAESPDGALWFVSQDSGVVAYDGKSWTRYGPADGLMDMPTGILATRQGVVWAVGSHRASAATARLEGTKWHLETHPDLSASLDLRGAFEAADGALWFGNTAHRERVGGLIRFDGKTWTQYRPPDAPAAYIYGIGQTSDGLLWFGGTFGLRRFDGKLWTAVRNPREFTLSAIDHVCEAPGGGLWVSARAYGLFRYDGKTWMHYGVRDGLPDNLVRSLLATEESLWASTGEGFCRFDGQAWTRGALPIDGYGVLKQSRDGAIWINQLVEGIPRTIRYRPDTHPPETEITVLVDRVSLPGNTVFAWQGVDPWMDTPGEDLQFSWRLDGGAWSAFSTEGYRVFLSLLAGDHTFEVRARDRDFNTDPTPALFQFAVGQNR